MLLRSSGGVERLTSTATVLGLFDVWECSTGQVELGSGDTLVVFSDGVTDSMSDEGEEFGEERLIETLRANRHMAVPPLLESLLSAVHTFSGREQEDDVTLLVARAR